MPPEFLRRARSASGTTRASTCTSAPSGSTWPGGDCSQEPQLLDAHIEEVRSGHSEEPEAVLAEPAGGNTAWDEVDGLGSRTFPTAVLSFVSPDGFPFSVRVPVRADRAAGVVRITAETIGTPLHAGLACLTAHQHEPDFLWQHNFQVRGDLVEEADGWAVVPHKVVGGFNVPKSQLSFCARERQEDQPVPQGRQARARQARGAESADATREEGQPG